MSVATPSTSETEGTRRSGGWVSYEDFLQWPGEDAHVEWVNGKVVSMSPVSKEHSNVGLFLLNLIQHYVEARDLGTVLFDPFQMKTGPDLPGRAPDILFVAKANLAGYDAQAGTLAVMGRG